MAPHSKSFLVWGAGGHGRVVAELILALGHRLVGFVDQDHQKLGERVSSIDAPVKYLEGELLEEIRSHRRFPLNADACALGVGQNGSRQRCLEALDGMDVPPLIHPSASVSPSARIGQGTVILPSAVVNTGASIGEAAIVNSGAVVEHDCILGAAVHISPGAVLCGEVQVGQRTWIGAGATIIPRVRVGANAIVGAGSLVIREVKDGVTVMGSPARARQE